MLSYAFIAYFTLGIALPMCELWPSSKGSRGRSSLMYNIWRAPTYWYRPSIWETDCAGSHLW